MKSFIPVVVIAIFGLLSFGSCKKSSSSTTCTCKAKGASGQDTTETFTTKDSTFSSLAAECTASDSLLKAFYGSSYGCHM